MLKKIEGLSDYCWLETDPDRRLSSLERLTMIGGDDLRKAAARMARSFGELRVSEQFHSIDVHSLEEAAQFYAAAPLTEAPHLLYPSLRAESPCVDVRRVHGFHDGEVLDISFQSTYVPRHPRGHGLAAINPANQTVRARLWRHHERPAGVVVALHGWGMGDLRLTSLALMPGLVYRLGYDVVLPELPYHGSRAGASSDIRLFPSTDAVLTNEAMAQAVTDLRELRRYIERSTATPEVPFGVLGLSLGGYVGSLYASLDALDFLVAVVPVVSLPDVGWELLRSGPLRHELRKLGLTKRLLEQVARIHSPLSYASATPRDRILIVAGREDRIVPSHHPRKLWRHFGKPELAWFDGGHLVHCLESAAFEHILSFLAKRGAGAP